MKVCTLCGAAALFASAVAASAAPPVPAPPVPAPVVYNWTGLYVGVHAGGGWSANSAADLVAGDPFPTGTQLALSLGLIPNRLPVSSSGLLGGVQAGYRVQRDALVFGLEVDASVADISGSASALPLVPALVGITSLHASHTLEGFGTLRARVGWLPTQLLQVYATGGLALGHMRYEMTAPNRLIPDFQGRESATRSGWVVGGGAELALDARWSAKAEYLYYELGDTRLLSRSLIYFAVVDNHVAGHILRAGANYRFGP